VGAALRPDQRFRKYLTENNVHLLKFFLHISKEEQAERLQSRLDNPHKQWKFETADLDMRADWKEFMEAYEIALNKCSTPWAPWHIIPAEPEMVSRLRHRPDRRGRAGKTETQVAQAEGGFVEE
jgi:polyphosphate kinase 2 (PPK2 family)